MAITAAKLAGSAFVMSSVEYFANWMPINNL